MNEPTEPQKEYADSLLDKMRQAGILETSRYEAAVAKCKDRTEMSVLITEMKDKIDQDKAAVKWL